MYSKCVGAFLRLIFNYLFMDLLMLVYNMYNHGCGSRSGEKKENGPDEYAFKAFSFERITPDTKTSRVPFPRSGHRIGADSANFYSFGGYNPLLREEEEHNDGDDFWIVSYPLFQELWKFNYASRRWTKFKNCASLPTELASNALILHRNLLMVYGGTGSPFGIRCSNQLHICKVNENDGQMLEVNTTGQLPVPLYGQAIVYHHDYLYTIGGTTGVSYTCDIHRLNLKTLVWEVVYMCNGQGKYEPKGRYRHEVGFDGNNIYVLGGGTMVEAYGFKHIPAFDVEKRVWFKQRTQKDPGQGFPAARRCHGAVQIDADSGSQVFITGGHDGDNVYDDLWKLDLSTFKWTSYSTCRLPQPMYFHAMAVSPEGRLYIFGGNSTVESDIRRTNTIYSTWLCIPKLSEMCWEAVLHYSPHINNCNSVDLINIGLPRHFINRLQCNPPVQ